MLPIFAHLQNENRRLRALNAEMLAALRAVVNDWHDELGLHCALKIARAIIAKAENDQQ
jgi:hypothetical protein